jgi:hypothetical protein
MRTRGLHDAVLTLAATQMSALLEGLDWRSVHAARETVTPAHVAGVESRRVIGPPGAVRVMVGRRLADHLGVVKRADRRAENKAKAR